jgi:apolipoprotein N-acyltransferase
MRPRTLVVFSAASAVLTTLAFPTFSFAFLAWVGLAPFLWALRRARPTQAVGLGLLFGWCLAAGMFYWLGFIPSTTAVTTFVMYLAFAVYYALFGLLYNRLSRLPAGWMLLVAPALWVTMEYARSSLSFLSLPWNLLAHSQYRYLPLIQISDLTGIYGVSFLLVMVNEFVSQVLEHAAERRRRESPTSSNRDSTWRPRIIVVGVMVIVTLSYGFLKLREEDSSRRLRVAVVQANVLTRDRMSVEDQIQHLRAYDRLTREAAKERPDLIVWPSSSLPGPLTSRVSSILVRRAAHETGVHVLVGGAGGDKFTPARDGMLPYSNSEFLVAPSGRVEGQYNKIRLTPFNEYVPLRGTIRLPGWITTLKDSFVAGTEYTLFQVGDARFGTPICWENTFPEVFRRFVRDGAQFMVSVTNEGFFGNTSGPHQTLAMNVFRAVENRVTIARAATTGVSGFISAKGEVLERVTDGRGRDLFVAGVVVRDVPLSDVRTFYTLHGDVFAHAMVAVAAASVIGARVVRRRPVKAGAASAPRVPAAPAT